jgi:protein-tyrosine phosphatase
MKVLFVCLGNICRSPAAEGVFLSLLEKSGQSESFQVDSAGTGNWHAGELPDARMREHALKRGISLESRARQFSVKDFEEFDYILVMDESNFQNVSKLDSSQSFVHKVHLMTDFCQKFDLSEVPDPYFGGAEGFEFVLDLVEDAGQGLLEKISREI